MSMHVLSQSRVVHIEEEFELHMAAKTQAKGTAKKSPRRTQQKFYRNIRPTPVGLRLRDDDGRSGRKIQLAARGQRGDCAPIKKGEQNHPDFIANKGVIFEVITQEEARKVAEKQDTNRQGAPHPALQVMRNPLGEEYAEGAVIVEQERHDQGRTVAETDADGQIVFEQRGVSQNDRGVVTGGVQIKRALVPGAEGRELEHVPDSIAPEEQAEYLRGKRQEAIDQAELEYQEHRKQIEDSSDEDVLAKLRANTTNTRS
jgi:YD repeat-containing protein